MPRCTCSPMRLHYGSSRVRGRALLRRPDLQEHRAQPAPDRQRPDPGLRGALFGGRARRRQGGRGRQDGLQGLLCPPGRLARLGADGRLGPAVADQRRDRGLGVGRLLQRPAADPGDLRPAGPEHRPGPCQGRRPLHDLHRLQARRRGQGLRRRADARLSRLSRRDHRRQPVPGHQRRAPHAHARLLPQRDHPPDGDRPRQEARHPGDRAAHQARGAVARCRRSSSPARRPR